MRRTVGAFFRSTAPANRIEGGLAPEAEPHVVAARIVGRLARELAAERAAKGGG